MRFAALVCFFLQRFAVELCCDLVSYCSVQIPKKIHRFQLRNCSVFFQFLSFNTHTPTMTMTPTQLCIPRDVNIVILSFFEPSYESLLRKFLTEITTCESSRLQAKCRQEMTFYSKGADEYFQQTKIGKTTAGR